MHIDWILKWSPAPAEEMFLHGVSCLDDYDGTGTLSRDKVLIFIKPLDRFTTFPENRAGTSRVCSLL